MTVHLQETYRSLARGGQGRSFLSVLFLLLVLWFAWVCMGRVKLHLIADAPLEMGLDTYPLELILAGRVLVSRLEVGMPVEKGDLLLKIDGTDVERGIHLWNQSLIHNLTYAAPSRHQVQLNHVLQKVDLLSRADSRYAQLFNHDRDLWERYWLADSWRRLRLSHGSLSEQSKEGTWS